LLIFDLVHIYKASKYIIDISKGFCNKKEK